MTPGTLAGLCAGIVVVAVVALAYRIGRREVATLIAARENAIERGDGYLDELLKAREGADEQLTAARSRLAALQARYDHLDAKAAAQELELARRRAGPLQDGETVALTTPEGRTLQGVVGQTFDDGAVLLRAAVIYAEQRGRGGEIELEQQDAGDVVVPRHAWAQRLAPQEA